ncbi:hypothetical protein [Brucella endophytica]|nr:hypothetical protein [Brucella endophytica]
MPRLALARQRSRLDLGDPDIEYGIGSLTPSSPNDVGACPGNEPRRSRPMEIARRSPMPIAVAAPPVTATMAAIMPE